MVLILNGYIDYLINVSSCGQFLPIQGGNSMKKEVF
jgi:hypothetical protein